MQDESDSPEQAFESFRNALRAVCPKDGDFGIDAALLAFEECLELAAKRALHLDSLQEQGLALAEAVRHHHLYRHYKGGMYTLLFVAEHHESRRPMAVYVSHEHGDSLNVRPLVGFPGDPDGWETPLPDGTKRFQLVVD